MTKNKSGKKDNKENKPKKNKAKRMKKEAMLHSVMSVFQSSPKEPFNYKQNDRRGKPGTETTGGRPAV